MQVVGVALALAGVTDIALGLLVIGPRVRDPVKRRVLVASLAGGGALLIVVGCLFVLGLLGRAP